MTVRELKEGLEAIAFHDANFRESRLIRLRMLNNLKQAGYLNEQLFWK